MKKVILTLFFFSTLVILSGCDQGISLKNSQKSIYDVPQEKNIDYSFGVNHASGGKVHAINIVPHTQSIRFFSQANEANLSSYGTGQEPLIIRIPQGDVLRATVTNNLSEATSIHRHGIRVPNDQDGVPGITQEAIAPGVTFTYEFPVHDEGVFRFHPHINTVEQLGKGLYGLLIVEPKTYPVDFDEELVWALKDYRVNQDGSLNENFSSMMDFTMAGRLGNLMTVNNKTGLTHTAKVGSHILLRLVNTSNARIYNFDFRGRDAQVVGTDGGWIAAPYAAGIVQLAPGERVSLLVTITTPSISLVDTYYPRTANTLATIQSVDGTGVARENKTLSNFPEIPNRSLITNVPDEVIHFGGIGMMGASRGRTINDGIRPDSNKPIVWELGEFRIVRLQNDSTRDHPIHLHGDFFQVIGINQQKIPWLGWKDTINVPAKGRVDIAILPTNPGMRMLHCHVVEHAEYGMMTVVKVE